LEKKEGEANGKIENLKNETNKIINKCFNQSKLLSLIDIAEIRKGTSITKSKTKDGNIPVIAGGQTPAYYHDEANRNGNIITISASGAYSGFVNYFDVPIFASDCNTIQSKDENAISTKLIYSFLKSIQEKIYSLQRGQAQPHVYAEDLAILKIPVPPLSEQQTIVSEIEKIEAEIAENQKIIEEIPKLKNEVLKKYL
jgi:type I restriction enzyme M protein